MNHAINFLNRLAETIRLFVWSIFDGEYAMGEVSSLDTPSK